MADIFLRLSKKWSLVRKPLVLIFSIVVLFLFGIYLFSINRMEGDAASHLLLAVSPILKIGVPYRDFWEIKPPVWPLTVYLWSNLFGFKILSMRIISFIVAGLSVLTIRLVYKKVFQTPVFEFIFISTVVIFLSPILYVFMLPTEMLGFLFSIGALLALIGFRKDFPKFYFSGLLFFATSQTKEPFTFTILAVLPLLIESLLRTDYIKFFKNSAQFLLGILTSIAGIFIYLVGLGSIGAYIEIFKYKEIFYPFKFDVLFQNFMPGIQAAERTFTEFSHGFSVLIILVILSFYFVNKLKKTLSFNRHNSGLIMKPLIILNSELAIKYSVFFYALGSFLGFGLGYTFGSHYLIQVVVPFYIMGGFILSYLFNNASFLFKRYEPNFYLAALLLGFSVIVLTPKRQYLTSYLPKTANFVVTDKVMGFEKRITELTTKDQCILSVYGWGVSEHYLYSGRKPCTRFFLPNIVKEDWQKREYAKSILDSPPAAIIYQTNGTDMDVAKFESETIKIGKIIKECYVQDQKEKIIYLPRIKDWDQLKNCIKTSST